MAIGISVKKAAAGSDPGVSKFFGDPTVPNEWVDLFGEDVIFFCQIRLGDIASLDTAGRLPHSGYLYIFLDTEMFPYTPMVYYYDGEPDTVIDGFNADIPGFEQLAGALVMSFEDAPDDFDGIRLFGAPSDWSYDDKPGELFMQYDPLEAGEAFGAGIDGYAYFFFGEDASDLEDISLHIERS